MPRMTVTRAKAIQAEARAEIARQYAMGIELVRSSMEGGSASLENARRGVQLVAIWAPRGSELQTTAIAAYRAFLDSPEQAPDLVAAVATLLQQEG